MRILRLQGYQPHAAAWERRIAAFEAESPARTDTTWESRQRELAVLGHPAVDGFADALRGRGHDANDLLFKIPAIRRAFVLDHGLPESLVEDLPGFLHAVLDILRPDVVIERDFGLLREVGIDRLRVAHPSISRFVLHHAVPHLDPTVEEADAVFVVCPAYRPMYLAAGARRIEVLTNAFYEPALAHVRPAARELDFTFSGRSGFGGSRGKWSRYTYLSALMERTPLQCWLGDDDKPVFLGLSTVAVEDRLRSLVSRAKRLLSPRDEVLGGGAPSMGPARRPPSGWHPPLRPLSAHYPDRVHAGVHGREMLELLGRSRVVFNRGPDREGDCSGTFRIFEVTAMGAALLTEWTSDVSDHFRIGEEIVTYRTVDECVALARELIADESRREEIANAGRRRTLRDHTWSGRAELVERLLMSL